MIYTPVLLSFILLLAHIQNNSKSLTIVIQSGRNVLTWTIGTTGTGIQKNSIENRLTRARTQ